MALRGVWGTFLFIKELSTHNSPKILFVEIQKIEKTKPRRLATTVDFGNRTIKRKECRKALKVLFSELSDSPRFEPEKWKSGKISPNSPNTPVYGEGSRGEFSNLINNKSCVLNTKLDMFSASYACHALWWAANKENSIEFEYFLSFSSCSAVQGSHRDSTKQNKDLAMLTQQHSSSNNLNNPSSSSANKNAAADADVNRSGPYFDVAASKNVRTHPFRMKLFVFVCACVKAL